MSELFETFDEAGEPAGLVARDEVHARGLWHRSAHVFLFDSAGALLIQLRAPGKDLYPNHWDYSVGEHLKPGEDYLDGALRGLREELNVTGVSLQPLGTLIRSRTEGAADATSYGRAFLDRELQQAFRGCYDGPLTPDHDEVAEVRWVTIAALRAWVAREPEVFTPWLLRDLRAFQII